MRASPRHKGNSGGDLHLVICTALQVQCLSCLVLSNTRRGWANVPRWGERQRRWLAARCSPLSSQSQCPNYTWACACCVLGVVQAITRVALLLLLRLVPRLVNVASCARSIFCPVPVCNTSCVRVRILMLFDFDIFLHPAQPVPRQLLPLRHRRLGSHYQCAVDCQWMRFSALKCPSRDIRRLRHPGFRLVLDGWGAT
jgi:hypothetical protein